jgi:DMSO/TMAO reductase YedYZ molybdopterin-dependent catalytic subunit
MTPAELNRRSFLTYSALGAATVGVSQATGSLTSGAVAGAPAILKPLPPERFIDYGSNAETRWDSVDPRRYLTPQADLFVRNHTQTPVIDAATYELRIHGDGLRDPEGVRLTLEDLKSFRHHETTTVHECTGNGRSFFTTQQGEEVSGTAWTLGAVGAVRWKGVRLADVLTAAGLRPEAVSVMATGLDANYVSDGVDYGPVRRPFPVEKALGDALLVWGANGQDLLPDHGYPLRLVLPGWIGIASIKWLGSLEVSASELTSPWDQKWYNVDGPLTVNPVRSALELAWNAEIEARDRIVLTGRSWSGRAPITRVEVSTDGGETWAEAILEAPGRPTGGHGLGWAQWSHTWRHPTPGRHEILVRATDRAGRTQPDVAAHNPGGYLFDAVVRHPVTVV